jgi:hypothetical protein
MSQLSIAQNSPTVFCFQYPAMVAGVGTPGAPVANFFPSCSKLVGAELVTAGGAVGTAVYLTCPAVVAGAGPLPLLRSNSNTDTSVYAIYWTNQVAYSPNQTILPC